MSVLSLAMERDVFVLRIRRKLLCGYDLATLYFLGMLRKEMVL